MKRIKTTRPTLLQRRLDVIKDMTPDEIAEFLEKKGVRATNGHCTESCPIAMYFKRHQKIYPIITVGFTTANARGEDNIRKIETINLPKNVSEFIQAFDKGKYPNLEPLEVKL